MFPAHNACTDKKINRVTNRCGCLLRQVVDFEGTELSEQQKRDIDLAWEANARHLCGDHSMCTQHAESQARHQGNEEVTYFCKTWTATQERCATTRRDIITCVVSDLLLPATVGAIPYTLHEGILKRAPPSHLRVACRLCLIMTLTLLICPIRPRKLAETCHHGRWWCSPSADASVKAFDRRHPFRDPNFVKRKRNSSCLQTVCH